MRPAGFTLLAVLLCAATIAAQVPPGPAVPPPIPAAVAAPNQKLDAHLAGWERTMSALKNLHFELELFRKDPASTGVFKDTKEYSGSVLCMKPNYARLRLDYKADPKDFEAFICNGKAVYAYNSLQKTITEHKMPDPKLNPDGGTDNLILDLITGMKAAQFKKRFAIEIKKEDEYYIYLDIKPILGKDKQEFQQLTLALYGPKTGDLAYLPREVLMLKPNNESEHWKLKNHQKNLPGIDAKVFQYESVQGFRFQRAPEQKSPPMIRPGVPTPPMKKGP